MTKIIAFFTNDLENLLFSRNKSPHCPIEPTNEAWWDDLEKVGMDMQKAISKIDRELIYEEEQKKIESPNASSNTSSTCWF